MDVYEFVERKDSTYFMQETNDYKTLVTGSVLDHGDVDRSTPINTLSFLNVNIMSRSTFHLGLVEDCLVKWNTDYLTALSRHGAKAAQVEGDLKQSVEAIPRLVAAASRAILQRPICCPICRYRVCSEGAMLDHDCSQLKFGYHLCPCDRTFRSHLEYALHALPSSTWLRKIDSESEKDDKLFAVLNWDGICGLALVQLLLVTAENNQGRFLFRCVCKKSDANSYENFVHYVAHLAVCEEFREAHAAACCFCYWPALSESMLGSFREFVVIRCQHPRALASGFNWDGFHTFFIVYKDTEAHAPSELLTQNGLFQSLVESEFDAKEFRFGGDGNEAHCRRAILQHIEAKLKEFDDYFSALPGVCPTCFCRIEEGQEFCSGGQACRKGEHRCHRCKCGRVFSDHTLYWCHMVVECRFYLTLHLVLFAVLARTAELRCACGRGFELHNVHQFMEHWARCGPMVGLMVQNCEFCEGDRNPKSTEETVKEILESLEVHKRRTGSAFPDFYVLGLYGSDIQDIIDLVAYEDPASTPTACSGSYSTSPSMGTSLRQNLRLFTGPLMIR